MAKRFLLDPAHLVYLVIYYFIYSHLFVISTGHSVALFALLHTSNPLTSADNVICLFLAGDTCCTTAATSSLFSSYIPPLTLQEELVFFNVTVLAGCAWKPQCVTLMTKVSANASLAQSALYTILIFCLSAGVSVRTHSLTGTVCCHT